MRCTSTPWKPARNWAATAAGERPAASPAGVSSIRRCRLPGARLSEISDRPGIASIKDRISAAACRRMSSSSCNRMYSTSGLEVMFAPDCKPFHVGDRPKCRRQALTTSSGVERRRGGSFRCRPIPATWLAVVTGPTDGCWVGWPTKTVTDFTGSPGSSSLTARPRPPPVRPPRASPPGVFPPACAVPPAHSRLLVDQVSRSTRTALNRSSSTGSTTTATPAARVSQTWRTAQETAGPTVRSLSVWSHPDTRSWRARSGHRLQRPACPRWAGRMKTASTSDTTRTKSTTGGKT